MKFLDFESIKNLNIPVREMYSWTEQIWKEQDSFVFPPKMRMWMGESGRFITMPACLPQYDIAGVKLISRNIDDPNGLPLRNSNIMLQKISEHGLFAVMDGTYITTMRTGACAAYNAIHFQKAAPNDIAVYGLGQAARASLLFYATIYDRPIKVKVLKYKDQAECFMQEFSHFANLSFEVCETLEELLHSDVVMSCVSFSHGVICDESVYPKGCTIVPVHTSGFQNCDLVFDKVIVDDIGHVQGYKYYDSFKDRMTRITDVANGKAEGRSNDSERIIVYNGGIAVHDMFYAMKVLEKAGDKGTDLPMYYPEDRFWMREVVTL